MGDAASSSSSHEDVVPINERVSLLGEMRGPSARDAAAATAWSLLRRYGRRWQAAARSAAARCGGSVRPRTAWGTPSARTSPAAPSAEAPVDPKPSRGTSGPADGGRRCWSSVRALRRSSKRCRPSQPDLSLKTPACVEEIAARSWRARARRSAGVVGEGYATVRRSSDRATSASPRDTERGRPRALSLETRSRLAGAVEDAKRGRERARGRGGSAGIGRGAPRCSSTSSWTRTSSWSRVTSGKNMQEVLREKLRSEVRLASRHVAQSAALRFPPRLDTDGV